MRIDTIPVLLTVCCLAVLCASCGGGTGGGTPGGDASGDISTSDQTVDGVPVGDAGCQADADCDDHISCTKDVCAGGGCTNTPDNSSCDTGETCVPAKGGCFKAKSCFKDEDCTDFIDCTVEGCNQDTKLCESIYDDARCPANTICVPFEWVQEIEGDMDQPTEKDPYVGCVATTRCSKDADCGAKDNPCCATACVAGICAFWPGENGASCSDGDPCNGEEICRLPDGTESGSLFGCYKRGESEAGACGAPPWGWMNEWDCEPGTPRDCDDADLCTVDSCQPSDGSCGHEPVEDGAPCGAGTCHKGICECAGPECQSSCCEVDEVCSVTGCCQPVCTGKSCGGDGCGGSCGSCSVNESCSNGACVPCAPSCDGKQCGDDGCGGSCGDCPANNECKNATCSVYAWVDPASGLMWQNSQEKMGSIWSMAEQVCADLDLGGHTDWRLPTIGELRSLIRGCPATESGGSCNLEDWGCLRWSCRDSSCDGCTAGGGPADGCYWPDGIQGVCGWYWSSSPVQGTSASAWGVTFGGGVVDSADVDDDWSALLRCVR